MLRAFRIPLTWTDLAKRTAHEVMADNCLGLAAPYEALLPFRIRF